MGLGPPKRLGWDNSRWSITWAPRFQFVAKAKDGWTARLENQKFGANPSGGLVAAIAGPYWFWSGLEECVTQPARRKAQRRKAQIKAMPEILAPCDEFMVDTCFREARALARRDYALRGGGISRGSEMALL